MRRAHLHSGSSVQGRALLVVRPSRDLQLLEAVVRQSEKPEHWHDEEGHIGRQIRVVLHLRRVNKQLPHLARLEQLLAVVIRNNDILPPMDEHRRAPDLEDLLVVQEPLVYEVGEGPQAVGEQLPNAQERSDQDKASQLDPGGERERGAGADGAPEDFDLLQGQAQRLRHEVQARESIGDDALLARRPGANAVTRVLHGENMHLELVAQEVAEPAAPTEILCVAMKEDDQETRRLVGQQQARHCLRIRLGRGADIARFAGAGASATIRNLGPLLCCRGPLLGHPRDPDQFARKAIDRVAGWWAREEQTRDELRHGSSSLELRCLDTRRPGRCCQTPSSTNTRHRKHTGPGRAKFLI
mmetsp:Transcript_10438/g.27177  ORF Transcript_10438/g.27177 Transcript_10438/m.27177 type:complete len:356 (+) Transcript_10438:652-1719(+)